MEKLNPEKAKELLDKIENGQKRELSIEELELIAGGATTWEDIIAAMDEEWEKHYYHKEI